MDKTCSTCRQNFQVTDEDLAFLDEVSPVFNEKKELIPPPTLCPDCRQRRRLASHNELHLFLRPCDLCKKRTLAQRPPMDPRPMYCHACWNSDTWDAHAFGQEMSFSRPFLDQVREVAERTPEIAVYTGPSLENSEYVHCADYLKNCYMIMHADYCEDCYYGYGMKKSRSCVDGYYNLRCELCYDCVDCHSCYDLRGSQDCINCSSGGFLRDCSGCRDCFLCAGLKDRQYCFMNEELEKSAYEARIKAINCGSYAEYQSLHETRRSLEQRHGFKAFHGHNLDNCSGDYLINCKNAFRCFDCEDVEDARYCTQVVVGAKNIADIHQWGSNLQRAYECAHVGQDSYNIFFSVQAFLSASDIFYSHFMQGCRDCFGCASMNHARYCILNKQYSKGEYEELVPKIIGHMRKGGEWGEFFPVPFSGFGYNLTTAQLFYPLSRDAALARGFPWEEYEAPPPTTDRTIAAANLPDDIADVTSDILQCAIVCEATQRPFRIIPQELAYYCARRLPLPRRSWLQRHLDRFARRNPRKLWRRSCAKCKKDIQTTYAPERPEVVYCESCYLQAVY